MTDYRSRYQPLRRAKAGAGWWAEWGLFLLVAIVAACLLLALAYPVLSNPDPLPTLKPSHGPDASAKAPESAVLERVGALEAAPPATESRARGQP